MKRNLQDAKKEVRLLGVVLLILVTAFVSSGAASQIANQNFVRNTQISQAAIANYLATQKNVKANDIERIKSAIDAYFTIRYEGQKIMTEQDFSILVEDEASDWVEKEKDKREIELYIASLFDLGYQSYKFNLDYDAIDIKNNKAVVKLRESHIVVYHATAPNESMLSNLLHTITLHYEKGMWVIYKDEYRDELSQQLTYMSKDDIKKQVDENLKLQNMAQPVDTSSLAVTNILFNRTWAVNYANIRSSIYNTDWYATEDSDCTNYTSQSLNAGGGKAPPDTSGMSPWGSSQNNWFYDFYTRSGSLGWSRVAENYTFIIQNASGLGPVGWVTNSLCYTQPGDIVQIRGAITPGEWDHQGIIVKTGNCTNTNTYYINAHTNDHYQEPLSIWASFPKRYIIISGFKVDTSGTQVFTDVPIDYPARRDIERLYDNGITTGCQLNPLKYCPERGVTRAEMAVFLLKGIYGTSYTPPPVGTDTGFADVPTTHFAAAWIKQFAALGITGGCATNPAKYCPDSITTHAQMAVFLLASKHYGTPYTPPNVGSETYFSDVPTSFWAGAWIKQVAFDDISYGASNCTPGNYCPNNPVTRAQMASMILRTFDLP